ncbi:MAG: aor 6 [Deltaproteobacteria bacterium]|nr:aor 6 [Deltaproteobacteria bacterium]
MKGYMGKIAWIDLSNRTVKTEELKEDVARKYLGGKGLGAYLLYKNLKQGTDPLDPDNLLIFLAGPLTGANFPCVGRAAVVTRSPMTGTFLDSYAGGLFGPTLKFAGFDAMVIRGKAEKPLYIMVDDGNVSFHDAGDLWGLATTEAEKRLKDEFRGKKKGKLSIAAIGPAAEKGVRFSGIVSDRRMFGRGGAGAVMGSKNVKAVVLMGSGKVPIADEARFSEVVARCKKALSEHPMTKKGGPFPRMGTIFTVHATNETGTFPTRNWKENTFEYANDIGSEGFPKYITKSRACYLCPIACSHFTKGSFAGREWVSEGPEYETIFAFGSNLEIKDPAVIIAADRLCDEYGMDTISCGGTIGFAMECFEKGLITKEDTGGVELAFGSGEAVLAMVHLIGKREKVGKLLSEGVKRASEKMKGSEAFAIHVKGLEPPAYDPRGMKGQGLTYALSDRGACHLRSNTLRTELLGIPVPIDRYGYEGKAQMIADLQLSYVAFDSIIGCAFGGFGITQADFVEGIAAATGWPFTVDELRTTCQRIWALTRLFNTREGFTRKDDTLPQRFFNETSTKGPSKGQVMDRASWEKMLDEYYEIVGWDKETGAPKDSRLKDLGIEKY